MSTLASRESQDWPGLTAAAGTGRGSLGVRSTQAGERAACHLRGSHTSLLRVPLCLSPQPPALHWPRLLVVSVSVVGKAKGGWPLPKDIFFSPHVPTCLPPTATPTSDLQDETWTLPFLSHQVLRGASALNHLVLAPKASLDLQLPGGVTPSTLRRPLS